LHNLFSCNVYIFQGATLDITQSNIEAAADAWVAGDETTYGDIRLWNTSGCDNFEYLFYQQDFNSNISLWDTSAPSLQWRTCLVVQVLICHFKDGTQAAVKT